MAIKPLKCHDFYWFWLLEGRVLQGAWVSALLGTLFGVQDYKKVKFPGRDISSLAVKGLRKKVQVYMLTKCALLLVKSEGSWCVSCLSMVKKNVICYGEWMVYMIYCHAISWIEILWMWIIIQSTRPYTCQQLIVKISWLLTNTTSHCGSVPTSQEFVFVCRVWCVA